MKGPIDSKNFVMLFEYRVLDCVGSLLGRSVKPMQVTPCEHKQSVFGVV